jgi:type IV pilus assembly protein PilO
VAIGDNLTKRDQAMVGVAILAVALAGLYWHFVWSPKNIELDAQAEHVEQLEGKNRRAKSEMAKGSVAELQKQAIVYQRNLEVMRQLVPTGNEVPALLDQVSTVARRVGLEISSVQPQAVIPGDQFDTYRYRLVMDGGYHRMGAFFAGVGSMTRIVAPVNLKLSPMGQSGGSKKTVSSTESRLKAEFEIQTYVARIAPAPDPSSGGTQ